MPRGGARPGAGRPRKPDSEKRRIGNPGKRPLRAPVTVLVPALVAARPSDPSDGAALVAALFAHGAGAWISTTDALATLSLVEDAWDQRLVLMADIGKDGFTQLDKDGKEVARPQVAMLRDVEKQLTLWLSSLGLNPRDRGSLGLTEVKAKTGLAALRDEVASKAGRHAG